MKEYDDFKKSFSNIWKAQLKNVNELDKLVYEFEFLSGYKLKDLIELIKQGYKVEIRKFDE